MREGHTHGKAEGHMDGGKHPLEDDHGKHDPWCLLLLLDKNVTTDPTKCEVYAWLPGR